MIHSPFSYYGGKSRIAHLYPPPEHDLIIEPFAGSAAYSFLHGEDCAVWINDLDPITFSIWEWLTSPEAHYWAKHIPPTVEAGQKVSQILPKGCPDGMIAYCRAEANQGTQGARGVHDQITTVGAKCWNARLKRKLSEVIPRVSHWHVTCFPYHQIVVYPPATVFVDPPYANTAGSRYRTGSGIDYNHLSVWCTENAVGNQMIVCENEGATWLPFTPLVERRGMKGRYQQSKAMEVVWCG